MTGRIDRLGFATLLFCVCATQTVLGDPIEIRIGWNVAPVNVASIAWREPRTLGLPYYGKSYTAQAIHFQGSGPQLTALASGRLDVGMVTPHVAVLAKQNANLDVKVIADVLNDPCDGRTFSQPFYVRKDSGIDKIADLKGKIVGVTTIGSGNDLSLSGALRKSGLAVKDVTKIEVSAGAIPGFLKEGKVHAGPLLPQFVSELDEDGRFKPLFTQCEALGAIEMVVHIATAEFVAKNRSPLTDMMARPDVRHPMVQQSSQSGEALRIASEATKQPKVAFENWLFTDKDYGRSADLQPNLDGLQSAVEQSAEFGLIKQKVQIAPSFLDLSLIEAAKRNLAAKGALP